MAGRLLGSQETERCSALPKMGETGLAVSLLMEAGGAGAGFLRPAASMEPQFSIF